MPRTNFESPVIALFDAVALRLGLRSFSGQGGTNRLPIAGNVYFQFGDLRVDVPSGHVVVEVESGGGLTNLVKYWQCLDSGLIKRPVRLIHLFRQVSANDYLAHIKLWHFLENLMRQELGARFEAALFTYGSEPEPELHGAIKLFESWAQQGAA